MKTLRSVLVLAWLAFTAVPAGADITMKMTTSTSGGPVAMDATAVMFVKGMKMRTDMQIMGQDMSMFVDIAARKQVVYNNLTKEVVDIGAAAGELPAGFGEPSMSVKPTGQTKELLGRTCAEFTIEITVPMAMQDEVLTIMASGRVWIAKDGPGVAEYQAFTKASTEAGLTSTLLAQGPHSKGLSQLGTALAAHGIPLQQDMQMSIIGSGPLAQMMAESGAGSMKTTMTVTAISVDPIPDERFTLPGKLAGARPDSATR